jgi:single-strand DNA-binding protein
MSGVNKVILIGRLGDDPDFRTTATGQSVSKLSLATSDKYEKNGKMEEKTEWHRVILWGKQAELASQYLKKGSQVYIEGKLTTRSWEDKENKKQYITEVVGNHMTFLGGGQKKEEENGHMFAQKKQDYKTATPFDDDSDIPF